MKDRRQVMIERIEAIQNALEKLGVEREQIDFKKKSDDALFEIGLSMKDQIDTKKKCLAWEEKLKNARKGNQKFAGRVDR